MSLSDLEYGIRELAESRFFGDDSHTDEHDIAYVCYMRYPPGCFHVKLVLPSRVLNSHISLSMKHVYIVMGKYYILTMLR